MNWLDKLERKYHKYAIPNLIQYIAGGMAMIFVFNLVNPGIGYMLEFNPERIMAGEIWRIFTFLFLPLNYGIIWGIFSVLFAWFVGRSLEQYWGTFKFNVYYFIGVLGTVLGTIIIYMLTGFSSSVTNGYIHTSMFLALCTLAPNYEIRIYMILPVKLKYLGWITGGFLIFNLGSMLLSGSFLGVVALLLSVANYLVFFGPRLLNKSSQARRRQNYTRGKQPVGKKQVRRPKGKGKGEVVQVAFHCCEVCGRTEVDDPELEFRYCSKCGGHHEYCTDHIFNHEHIKE